MNKPVFAFIIVLLFSVTGQSKTTHFLTITPKFQSHFEKEHELNFVRVTLFTENRQDSLVLLQYNNCLEFKGKLPTYNGRFILIDKQIKYVEAKVEHPRFLTIFAKLNKTKIFKDSVDVFNKRHHILIYNTDIVLEKECETAKEFDYLFWSNNSPKGGYFFRNEIGVLLQDTLPDTLLTVFSEKYNLIELERNSESKRFRFKLKETVLKDGKNKIIKQLLLDSLIVRDAGAVIDTVSFTFISSFLKVASLPIKQINKLRLQPISGLKKLTAEMNYIKDHKLEYGCGLYRCKDGSAYELLSLQNDLKNNHTAKKCEEKEKLLKLEFKYFSLQTINLSNSGGKDEGRKRELNLNKMVKIHEKEKLIKSSYLAKMGRIDLILIE